jgi:hypothetical protein
MLAKGPNVLMPLLQVIVMWRSWSECLVWDLHKAYNAMKTGEDEAHMRRFMWHWGEECNNFTTFCFMSVHFGDRLAAVLMEEARAIAIRQGRAIDAYN